MHPIMVLYFNDQCSFYLFQLIIRITIKLLERMQKKYNQSCMALDAVNVRRLIESLRDNMKLMTIIELFNWLMFLCIVQVYNVISGIWLQLAAYSIIWDPTKRRALYFEGARFEPIHPVLICVWLRRHWALATVCQG